MNRLDLTRLAEAAALMEKRTRHLTEIGKPLRSLAIELEAEKQKDPLRPLLEQKP